MPGSPLTETTIQRATAVLRAALNDCKALKVNPAAGIELRVPKRKPIVWTPSASPAGGRAAAGGGRAR